jgi:hypothetical protein
VLDSSPEMALPGDAFSHDASVYDFRGVARQAPTPTKPPPVRPREQAQASRALAEGTIVAVLTLACTALALFDLLLLATSL